MTNHREHFLKIMAGETSDWIPNYELALWGQTIERWLSEGMPPGQVYLGDWFEGEPFFQFDRRGFAKLNIEMIPPYEYEVLEEDERYLIARHANGIVTKALKEGTVRGTRMTMDTYIDFPVKDRATWEQLKRLYDPHSPTRYPFWWDEQVKTWEQRDYPVCLLGNGTFGLYSRLRSWVGTENLCYLFYDEPALVEEMIEYNTDFFLELVEPALQQVQFDYFNFFEDCAGKGGPLYSPQIFRKFFQKPYRRIIDRLNRAGIRSIWLDSDGDPEVLLPLWMDAGVNVFWPLEQASGMDPLRLTQKYGKNLVLCGGLDKIELARGKDAINRELYSKIPPLLEQGGYIPHIDHAISPELSYSDFLVYLELKMKLIGR